MKKIIWLFLAISLNSACKKAIQDKKQDAMLDAITNGQWFVYSFEEGDSTISSLFAPYTFQFYKDGKVSGFTSEGEEKGIWEGNANTLTISSAFDSTREPLNHFNAIWKLTNYTYDYVKAETIINGLNRKLHLQKK